MTRETLLSSFLASTEWSSAKRAPLAGDASNRRYERLTDTDGKQAVLMDAPPEKGEDVRPFVKIAEFLTASGLSAPRILAEDTEHGFLLLEDLGDALFARVIPDAPELEETLYAAATDVLLALHDATPPEGLSPYDGIVKTDMAALAYRWYRDFGSDTVSAETSAFKAAFQPLMKAHFRDLPVLVQRDYHAENLLWLPEREGAARVGLLDFQDAMLGHPAYDLVSLLQDARRDVPEEIETRMIRYYCEKSGTEQSHFEEAYALLGAQRNLRILGVFGRLSLHANKPHYVDFIPRVWGYLLRDLEHPVLAPVRDMILQDLPEPTDAHLEELKSKCGTIPTL